MNHFPRSSSSLSPRSGSILITVIWILVFFSILSVGISRVAFSQIDLFRRVEGWELSTPLIRSVCLYVQQERAARKEYYDTLAELRRVHVQELGIARADYTLTDEESRIDVNTAAQDVLARLPGVSPDLARNIASSALRPFSVPEEMLLVEGFDRELLEKCRPWITVYSGGKVNINTAPLEVLAALGMDETLAGAIISFRAGPDRMEGTDDDGVFTDVGEIDQKLKSFAWTSDAQKAKLLELIQGGLITVGSQNFTLQAQTFVAGKPAMTYAVVFNRDKVKRWQEQ